MARKQRRSIWLLFISAFFIISIGIMAFSLASRGYTSSAFNSLSGVNSNSKSDFEKDGDCCRGVEGLELWGPAVKWGTDHRLESAKDCCDACKSLCPASGGECKCDSWVFCGDKERCKEKFGECWLKKQKDVLSPEIASSGEHVMWTSGLIFGKKEGIIGLETSHGTIHIKLIPDCALRSMLYITDLLRSHHCVGCGFFRAEGRGRFWDYKGDHIPLASYGPPYALLQGTFEADGVLFKEIPTESCPSIKRGSVAWVGSGPEFFVSLANHNEWSKSYTVFGFVLSEDLSVAEKIASLPTKSDTWDNVTVSVLQAPVYFTVKRSMGSIES